MSGPWSPFVCLPTLASSKTLKRSRWEGGRLSGRVLGRSVGNTPKWGARSVTRQPFSKAHFKTCFRTCTVNIWERREEERSEGGAVFEQRWGFYSALLLSLFPLNPARTTKLLMRSLHSHRFSTFTQFWVTFILLTSHFLRRLFRLRICFPFERSASLRADFGGCAALLCVLLAGVSGGAKGIASGRPVTCKGAFERTRPVPHGWQLFTEKMLVWLRYVFFFSLFIYFFYRCALSFCRSPLLLFMRNKTLLFYWHANFSLFVCAHKELCLDRNVSAWK